jgi:hypothetical protein
VSRILGLIALLALLGGACTSEDQAQVAEPNGPAQIRPEVVRRHAQQFETELADREAGSQGEQAAAVYILGHLQQAGYFVQLDGVPVGDLVRSTNLVARPPSGEDPDVVVAAAYGTEEGGAGRGAETVGVFLELARALRVAEPEHSIEFVALGAEGPGFREGDLGSRRLAKVLLDEEINPLIITLAIASSDGHFYTDPLGTTRDTELALVKLAKSDGLRPAHIHGPKPHATVLSRAGLDHMRVVGPEQGTGEVLLEYLEDYSR